MKLQDKLHFETTTLPNGHILHTQPSDLPVTYVRISVPVGSAHSHSGNANCAGGYFHFLEHMCFERSELNPDKTKYTELMSRTGSSQNAWTDAFYTVYNFESPAHTFTKVFSAFLNKIIKPLFLQEDIAIQRNIIINERNQRKYYPGEDSLSQYVMTKWMNSSYYSKEQLFGADNDLSSLTPEKLRLLHNYYFNQPICIFVAGTFNLDIVKAELSKLPIPNKKSNLLPHVQIPIWSNQNYNSYECSDIDRPVYHLGGIRSDFTVEDFWAVDFILQMLTHEEFGTLQNWIRKEKGWSYGLEWNLEFEKDRIIWSIKIPLESSEIAEKIRAEIHTKIKSTVENSTFITATRDRLLLQMCFDYETIASRLDIAVMTYNLIGSVSTEQNYRTWLTNTVSDKYIINIYKKHFAPEHTGEFLALPK
jgi:predicted Zn-dependent peptidase